MGLATLLGIWGLVYLIWTVFFGLIVAGFVFWILMIIDVAQRKFRKSDQQIIWLLIVVLVGFIGAIIYYFVVKRKKKK